MKLRSICLSVYTVVFLSLIVLTSGLCAMMPESEPEISEELAQIDPTDMSLYYAMGEYYPPDTVDTLNIDWQGGRVEVVAYNGSDYFVEEASTRYLLENERLAYTLDGSVFSLRFTDTPETVISDAYKKIEVRIPREIAAKLKSLNINTNGEVILKNITAEKITVNGKTGNVAFSDSYSSSTTITTTSGNVNLAVDNAIGYGIDFRSKQGRLDSYIDNGLDSYVSGDGKYPFTVKTKSGNLDVTLYQDE